MLSHISFTTSVLTMNTPSDTLHLTCNSRFTVMPLTSLSPRLSKEFAVIYTWVTKQPTQKTLSNVPLWCHTTLIKNLVSSVSEAEFGAILVG
jgi:hypothetical protein